MHNTATIVKITLITACALIIAGQIQSVADLAGRKSLLTRRETELAELKKEQSRLKKQALDVETPEFIEREARDKLGMGRDGETIVLMPSPALDTPATVVEAAPDDTLPTWQRWVRLFF
jgi:cell division protein FtsB